MICKLRRINSFIKKDKNYEKIKENKSIGTDVKNKDKTNENG